jgi:hypothetical protein
MPCAQKQEWQAIKHFAKQHKLYVRNRNVMLKKDWLDKSKEYEIDLPFAVLNNNAVKLTEPLEHLL